MKRYVWTAMDENKNKKKHKWRLKITHPAFYSSNGSGFLNLNLEHFVCGNAETTPHTLRVISAAPL